MEGVGGGVSCAHNMQIINYHKCQKFTVLRVLISSSHRPQKLIP